MLSIQRLLLMRVPARGLRTRKHERAKTRKDPPRVLSRFRPFAVSRSQETKTTMPDGRMIRRLALSFCLLVASASLARAEGVEELRERLAAALAPVADRAFVGLYVGSLTHGDVLCAVNADLPFMPASNEKLA